MNVIVRYPLTPADDHDRSRVTYAEQTRRYQGHEALKLKIALFEAERAHMFGSGMLRMNDHAIDALEKTEAHTHLDALIDELKVALVIMETQFESLGI